ncbi:MAG: hypothetical protein LBC70_10155, partial [Chitinispirillales bacterium]|nr:hypothetical protein [Chitinispirillales bacterium]
MKQIFTILAVMLAASVILTSCQPSIVGNDVESIGESPNYYDFSQIFETFWRGMDRNYPYWSEEPTELWDPLLNNLSPEEKAYILRYPESFWDRIYDYFKPRFEALGVFPVIAPDNAKFVEASIEAWTMFSQMVSGIRDGHFNVLFNQNLYISNPDPATAGEWPYINLPFIYNHLGRIWGHFEAQNPPNAGRVFMESNLTQSGTGFNPETTPFTYDFVTNILESNYLTASSVKRF